MDSYFDFKITPQGFPSKGIMFVNHEKNHRSGHLSHALVSFKEGSVMSVYSNCSGTRNKWAPGHNGFGWLEYKISEDYGLTWGKERIIKYSYDSLINETFTVSCEKAVSTRENEIVCLCIRNENPNGWEPYLSPVAIRSEDGGETWSDPISICAEKGRIYDALVRDGKIYVLLLANDDFLCTKPEHKYHIYESDDHGLTYTHIGTLPGDTYKHAYGNMVIDKDGNLICYEYDSNDEYNLVYHKSSDMGRTWFESGKSYCAKRIRNPQVVRTEKGYFLHGRSGCVDTSLPMNFVLYTSLDGINWDEGRYIYIDENGQTAYYSNNLLLRLPSGKERVLIQSSIPYSKGGTNIAQFYIDL